MLVMEHQPNPFILSPNLDYEAFLEHLGVDANSSLKYKVFGSQTEDSLSNAREYAYFIYTVKPVGAVTMRLPAEEDGEPNGGGE